MSPTALAIAVAGAVLAYLIGYRVAARRATSSLSEPTGPIDRTDRARSMSDDHLDPILGALPLGVVVVAEDGSALHKNHLARRYEGGRHGDALVEAALAEAIESIESGEPIETPIDVYGPPPLHLRMQGTPIAPERRSVAGLVTIEDVTGAQQIDRIRKDFVANVSHELKTPIGAIGLLAETLLGTDDRQIVTRLAARLHEQSIRLADLIDDLLALSKLEAGPITDPELMDVREVVGLAIERTVTDMGRTGVAIRCTEETPAFVDGDRSQLVAAVSNLLDNAIKYSEERSEVRVNVTVEAARAVIAVVDQGLGIPETDVDRVFERFYRVDDGRSRTTGGTGLGLSIVRHAVLNHGGTVSVESVEGQGSTFTIRLPLAAVRSPDERRPVIDLWPDPAAGDGPYTDQEDESAAHGDRGSGRPPGETLQAVDNSSPNGSTPQEEETPWPNS